MEVFYKFAWGARRPDRTEGGQKNSKPPSKPQNSNSGKRQGKKKISGEKNAKLFQARPTKTEKPIDPDNPFAAALMGFNKK